MLNAGNVGMVWDATPERLQVRQKVKKEVIEIEGINYTFDLFRGFSSGKSGLVLNEPFKITRRDNGVIAMEKVGDEEIPFKVLCARFFRNKYPRLTKLILRK